MPRDMYKTRLARQKAYLDALTGGANKTTARNLVGVKEETVRQWRLKSPEFATQERDAYVVIRAQRKAADRHDPLAVMSLEPMMAWRRSMFGHETYWHQQKMLQAFYQSMCMANGGITMILTHPESGKSTLVNDWIVKRLSLKDSVRIAYVSGGQDRGRRMLGRIKNRLTTNTKLIAADGPFYEEGQERRGMPWSADQIKVCTFTADEADFSCEAKGWTSEIAGQRVDVMILDDVQSLKTLNQTDEMFIRLRQDFFSRITSNGIIIIIATRVAAGDVYDRFLKENLIDHLVQLPATDGSVVACELGDQCPTPDDVHNAPLCPELWTPHRLLTARKRAGEQAWHRNWMQAPRDDSITVFKASDIEKAWLNDLDVGAVRESRHVVIGCDPAIDGNCALVTCAYGQNDIDVIDVEVKTKLGSASAVYQMIEQAAMRHRPAAVIIETNSWQKLFHNDERLRDIAKRYSFVLRPNDSAKWKADPILGVAAMATSLERGEINLAGTANGKLRLQRLTEELLDWRRDQRGNKLVQDTVMAMWFVWRWWFENKAWATATQTSWGRGQALPYKPTLYPHLTTRPHRII